MIHNRSCTNCGKIHPGYDVPLMDREQWWGLMDHYGISGVFCSKCYELVSHDSFGVPRHPKEYKKILNKQKSSAK